MDGFVRQHVDYCQYQVRSAPYWRTGMHIYLVGDELLHVSSPTECTGFAATHTGGIEMRVVVLDAPPTEVDWDWDAISETTLWSPRGELSVRSIMGHAADELAALSVPPGLIRVRVHARHLVHESVRTDDDPPEQHQLVVWPVHEDTGTSTLRRADERRPWEQKPAKAAEYAMLDVIRPYDTHEERDPELPRVTVVRPWPGPPPAEGRLPVGDLTVELTRTGADTLEWRWAGGSATLPDDQPSVVRVTDGNLRHEGVTGRHAVMLGLVWDHLRTKDPEDPPAWEPVLQARAAEERERAERNRRFRAEEESRRWGGAPPTDRLRALPFGHAMQLARLNRPVLDRLAAMSPQRQREVAVWAARQAMRVAGLDRIGWIAEALEAVEAGGPLPRAITADPGDTSRRLFEDPATPRTTVTLPGGPPNFHRASVAFPALLALAAEDPLPAAIDAVYGAACAHGVEGYATFLNQIAAP
ncbi:MAG TPA: hypothetical protein VN408_40985 [Actinoplanes sp.]|nr:hypothetical protein [Actinoplanes sp.]